MGIAVQAPADPLLAIVAGTPAGECAAGNSPPPETMFAAMLAGIFDGQAPAVGEGAITGPALPLAAGEPEDQDATALSLALLASIASPRPILHLPAEVEGAGPATSPDGPSTVIASAQGPASSPAPALLAAGAAMEPSLPPSESSPAEAPTPVEADTGPAGAAPAHPEGQPPAPAASLDSEAIVGRPASTVPAMEPPADSARPGQSSAPDPVAPGIAPASEGVVRSVGNASESAPGRSGDHPGRKPDDSRPLPRASASGIEHAAPNSAVGELRQAPGADAPAAPPQDVPAPAGAPTDLPPQVDQVASAVIERVEAGGGEARIHLEPLELGEVVIHVRTEGDQVRIDVRAERPDAARLLRDHTHDLSGLLGSRGLNLSDVNVGVGGGNAGSPFESRHDQPRPVAGDFAAVLGLDDVSPSAGLHHRLRAAYNPDGALLYRV